MALVTVKTVTRGGLVFALCYLSACTTAPKPAPVEDRSREAPDAPVTSPTREPLPPVSEPETALPEQKAVPLPAPVPESPVEPAPDSPATTSPAVIALLDNADQYIASGRNDQAVASIERALRIDPKNPQLWQRLSRIRLQQQRWDQAIATARKSNVLATGNNRLRIDNWLIIAKALEAKGDKAGASQAIEQARMLHR